jgi:hypothetical protein
MAMQLAQAMLDDEALARTAQRLSVEARSALAEVLQAGGALPGHRLALKYGAIRRLGPARVEREQPWLHPAGALEELYYSGLIYRTYGQVGGYYGETLIIPQQLAERLQTLSVEAPRLEVAETQPPPRVRRGDKALTEDLFATLVRLRQQRVEMPTRPQQARDLPSRPMALALGPRLVVPDDAERLDLIWHLLWRLRLVRPTRGVLQVSPHARRWLRAADGPRARAMYLAWRDDVRWDELCRVPTLRCEDTGWQSNPVVARRNLEAVLARCPADVWLSLDSFVAMLKQHRPDYLRPDGDFDSWFIRDAETDRYLQGFASWDRVEGDLARHLLVRPLCWLGIIDVGLDEDDRPVAVMLTGSGRSILSAARAQPADGSDGAADAVAEHDESPLPDEAGDMTPSEAPGAKAVVDDDFGVTIPLRGTLYDRYQLERFSEWQEQDNERAVYRITAESVWKSQDAGIQIEQILSFLRRIGGEGASSVVLRTLQAWGGRFGRVFIRRQVVLQTADEQTMQQITQQAALRALLGEPLSPTTRLVDEAHVDEITRLLKTLGIWPHIRL